MATKEILNAYIEFDNGERMEFETGTAIAFAHTIIEKNFENDPPLLQLALPDHVRERFETDAEMAWHSDNRWLDKKTYVIVWVEQATKNYFAIERIKHAYNELVLTKLLSNDSPKTL